MGASNKQTTTICEWRQRLFVTLKVKCAISGDLEQETKVTSSGSIIIPSLPVNYSGLWTQTLR